MAFHPLIARICGLLRGAAAAALLAALLPGAALAQQPEVRWQERQTSFISILYPAGSEAEAEHYAGFVDALYDEVTALIGYQPAPPLTLRIYPTLDLYQRVNPLAQADPGFLAYAHTGRREISISVPQTADLSEEEIRNNVRHELTHIIAADLSGNKLPVMWQEGLAQYVEQPAPQLELKLATLRQIIRNGHLHTWSQLDAAGVMYSNPRVGYPQSWSMASFLVQRNGMATFVDFMKALDTAPGYRSALQQAYEISADQLEREWGAQLESWIEGGWRSLPSSTFDVAGIQAALDSGRYAEAVAGAERILPGLADEEERARLQILLDLAHQGLAADMSAQSAREALLRGDYQAVAPALATARSGYGQLSRADMAPILEIYAARASDGQRAYLLLQTAASDMKTLRFGAARKNIEAAAVLFSQLGDQRGRAAAQAALDSLNKRLRVAALILLGLVVTGLAWNIDRRRAARRSTLPFG